MSPSTKPDGWHITKRTMWPVVVALVLSYPALLVANSSTASGSTGRRLWYLGIGLVLLVSTTVCFVWFMRVASRATKYVNDDQDV